MKNNFNRDSATFRFRDGSAKIVGDVELSNTFKLKAIDPFWNKIYSIQTVIQSKVGLGLFIYVEFFAPFDLKDSTKDVKYDYRKFGDDSLLDFDQYCLKQWYRI